MLIANLKKRKRVETRSWSTSYRGPFAIQPTEVLEPHQNEHERAFGDYYAGRFGFVTDYAAPLSTPIPARGRQLFWSLSAEQQTEIARQLPMAGSGLAV
jgi:hypothetical protein